MSFSVKTRVALGNFPIFKRIVLYVSEIVGERVRARIAERFGEAARQSDVAAQVGMTPDAFSRSLNGQRNFATIELVRLAHVLSTSLHWLVTGEQDPATLRVAARHTFDHAVLQHESVDWSAERSAIETVATAYRQAYAGLTGGQLPTIPQSPAEARAALVAHSPSFVRDFAEAAEGVFGIEVVRIAEANRSYSILVLDHRVVVVQPHVNWFFQNWSIAHEIGHFATGQLESVDEAGRASDEAEGWANAYAAELLLPEAEIRSIDWATLAPRAFADRLWTWGVSTDAVKRRLATLRIVPGASTRELLGMSTQRVLRLHWADEGGLWADSITERMERANTRRFPAGLLNMHTSAVAAGRLQPEYLAWMLDTDPEALGRELAPAASPPDLDWLMAEMGIDQSTAS